MSCWKLGSKVRNSTLIILWVKGIVCSLTVLVKFLWRSEIVWLNRKMFWRWCVIYRNGVLLLEFVQRVTDILKHYFSVAGSASIFRQEAPNNDSAIAFLDVLVIRVGWTLNNKAYRKHNHTGRYLHFRSNHPPRLEREVVESISQSYQEQQVRSDEIVSLEHDIQLNTNSTRFINYLINKHKKNILLKREVQQLGFIFDVYWTVHQLDKRRIISN